MNGVGPDPSFDSSPVHVLEVGGTHVTAALVHGSRIVRRHDTSIATIATTADRDRLLDAIAEPALRLSAPPGAAWAVAIPGPIDYARGRGDFAGVGKFDAIAGVDLRTELAGRLRTEPEEVRFLNDAVAYGLGEWAFGAAGRVARLVCITLGTGVGSAFVADGMAVSGGHDVPPEGYAHLIEIDGRPLEDFVSTRAIVADYARRSGRVSTVEMIARAAPSDQDASDSMTTAMHTLGVALAPWILGFRAEVVVIGGSISRSWHLIEHPMREGLDTEPRLASVLLQPSTLLDTAPLVGAGDWLRRTPTNPDDQPMTMESR